MKLHNKLLALGLTAAMCCGMLAGCGTAGSPAAGSTAGSTAAEAEGTGEGVAEDSPYAGMGFDLKDHVTIHMYAIGDRPADMDEVLAKLNSDYLTPWLNAELDVQFLNWSDYTTKYSLVLAGGEPVDLMFTSNWCYYQDETAKGAFRELTEDYLRKYMPYSYEDFPGAAWDQAKIGDKLYAVPRNYSVFEATNWVAVRSDCMEKYGYESLNSWEDYKNFMIDVAADSRETGIMASAQDPTRLEIEQLWPQIVGIRSVVSSYSFCYKHNNSEDAPNPDDIFFLYDSDYYADFAREMAELASKGCWSTNAINDTTDPRDSFSNGTSASYSFNGMIFAAGKALESAGLGTYEAYDVTPETYCSRGAYANDCTAIATNSANPERATLVLDCLMGFPEVNNLIVGGIEGKHWQMTENGDRITLDAAPGYAWAAWAWNLQTATLPVDASEDPRARAFADSCAAKEFKPITDGFTFDRSPVEAEYNVINSVCDEYRPSFGLGVYGDQTDAKLEEFRSKLAASGLDKVTEEFRRQYIEWCAKKGITF